MPLTDTLPVSPYPAFYVGRYALQAAEIIEAENQTFKTDKATTDNTDLISTYTNSSEVTAAKPSVSFTSTEFAQQDQHSAKSNFKKEGLGNTLDIYA